MEDLEIRPIAIAGAGRLGPALGRLLREAGEPVVAVASRRPEQAVRGASFIGGGAVPASYARLPALASRILITVADDAIPEVARLLAGAGMRGGVALHTCGAQGPEALAPLAGAGVEVGVLHPLQTIPSPEQGVEVLRGICFGVTASGGALVWAERIVHLLGGRLLPVAAERRPCYHAAGVMASNYLVAVIDAALVLMEEAGIDRRTALPAVAPVAEAACRHALKLGPGAALTGPILRGDRQTVASHLRAVDQAPRSVARLYRAAGLQALAIARRRGLDEARARPIEALLRDNED